MVTCYDSLCRSDAQYFPPYPLRTLALEPKRYASCNQRKPSCSQCPQEDEVISKEDVQKHYLVASDFDQTLSFNDSEIVLSELLGISGFEQKVAGLSRINLVQQGGELAYLLLHDPEYRCVRKEHLVEVGKRIRLKENIVL